MFLFYLFSVLFICSTSGPFFRGGSKLQPIPGVSLFAADAYKKEEEA